MASLGDLTLFVSAETQKAQKDIQGLGKEADKVVGQKRDFEFSFKNATNNVKQFKRNVEELGNVLKTSAKVGGQFAAKKYDDEIEAIGIVKDGIVDSAKALNNARKPAKVLGKSFQGISGTVVGIVDGLAKVGFALYGIQQITGVLQQAFGGMFKATVGESIRLQESILKTQTALASTNDVLRNGEVITEPYEAIVALTGTIEQRIASIRDRSLELAGVTSNEVIEVFGMVSQQIGAIGGSLKDAEDLAIAFAGALGTFGIPLYQARQEIGSILRGDITTDSYLAKSLGITNEDVTNAKQSTEGVVGFLEKRLKTAVAGQKIAAESFAGVASNIADFKELFGQAFGDGLVQPLIDGLTKVYNLLVLIKDNALTAATSLGQGFGGVARILGGAVGTGVASITGDSRATIQASNRAQMLAQKASNALIKLALDIRTTLREVTANITNVISKLGTGLAKLGAAFVSLNVQVFQNLLETFKLLTDAVSSFAGAFQGALELYAGFLTLPGVQYLAELGAQFKLLEVIGVASLIKVVLTGGILLQSLQKLRLMVASVVAVFKGALAAALATVGGALQGFAVALDLLLKKLGVANVQLTAFITQLQATGTSATSAASKLGAASGAAATLGKGILALTIKFLAFNAVLFGIQFVIATVVKAVADLNEEAKRAKAFDEFNESLTQLNTTFKDVNENSTAAQQALKRVSEAAANNKLILLRDRYVEAAEAADEYEKTVKRILARTADPEAARKDVTSNLSVSERMLRGYYARRDEAETELNEATAKHEAYLANLNLEEDITTRSKQHGKLNENLAKARKALNKSIRDKEFAAEQELAQKRVQLFQAQENLRIRKLDIANRKLIQGEEGASRTALEALNNYISQREKGEVDIEAQRRQAVIAVANVEKSIADYQYDIQQKILELKKKGLKVEQVAAELAGKKKEAQEAGIKLQEVMNEETNTPTAADLGINSLAGFESAKRSSAAIDAQINAVRERGQDLTNQNNLDALVNAIMPRRALEGFSNEIIKAEQFIMALGSSTGQSVENIQAAADIEVQKIIIEREAVQAIGHMKAKLDAGQLSVEEYNLVLAEVQKKFVGPDGVLKQLDDELKLRQQANKLLKEANNIQSLGRDVKSGTLRTTQNIIMGNAQMAAGTESDLFTRNRILAQGRIDARRAELEQDGPMSEDVAKKFEEFKNAELFNAERQAEMDGLLQRFQQLGEIAKGVGNAISSAFTQGFADILSGASSVQDVLGNMFKSIADSFMQMSQKIIADMIKMLIFKTLLNLFGGGNSFAGGASFGQGVAMPGVGIGAGGGILENSGGQGFGTFGPNFGFRKYANGGIVTSPTHALIGEAGMNEAVVPLPNGKAIPVDFGKGAKMGGDVTSTVTVNIDNSGGSSTEMSGNEAGKLGKAIDVAVKRVIMDEKRAGGLLHNGRR